MAYILSDVFTVPLVQICTVYTSVFSSPRVHLQPSTHRHSVSSSHVPFVRQSYGDRGRPGEVQSTVVKTCQSGSLKFIKYQDVEDEVEEKCKNGKLKLIATTVSSREKGIRRREEGWTTSSQKTILLQRNQGEGRDKLMKVDDDSPTCIRNSRNNNDDETKTMEDLRGKGGGRLKQRTLDGNVPLCLRKM